MTSPQRSHSKQKSPSVIPDSARSEIVLIVMGVFVIVMMHDYQRWNRLLISVI